MVGGWGLPSILYFSYYSLHRIIKKEVLERGRERGLRERGGGREGESDTSFRKCRRVEVQVANIFAKICSQSKLKSVTINDVRAAYFPHISIQKLPMD